MWKCLTLLFLLVLLVILSLNTWVRSVFIRAHIQSATFECVFSQWKVTQDYVTIYRMNWTNNKKQTNRRKLCSIRISYIQNAYMVPPSTHTHTHTSVWHSFFRLSESVWCDIYFFVWFDFYWKRHNDFAEPKSRHWHSIFIENYHSYVSLNDK